MPTEDKRAGIHSYEKARAQLSFLSDTGKRLGDWPQTTDRDGTIPAHFPGEV